MARVVLMAALLVGLATAATADYDVGLRAYQAGDYVIALKEFRRLAEQGDARAQYALGQTYAEGKGIAQSDPDAIAWYRKAAEQGFGKAQHNLAVAYDTGKSVPQDHAMAALWYRKAAEQGDPRAQNNLGYLYETGRGLPKDYAKAVKWYRKAAEQGNSHAQVNLANSYRTGKGVPKDRARAAMWYRRAIEHWKSPSPIKLWVIDDSGEAKPYPVALALSPPQEPAPVASPASDGGSSAPLSAVAPAGPETAPAPLASAVALKEVAPVTETNAKRNGIRVQLGAFRNPTNASRGWKMLRAAHPDVLGGFRYDLSLFISRVDLGPDKGVFFRLQVGPFTSEAAPKRLCSTLKSRNVDCFLVRS